MANVRAIQSFKIAFASNITSTSALDLGSESYSYFQLGIPTMASSADLFLQASADNSTFRRVRYGFVSGLTAPTTIVIGSSLSNCFVDVPNMHHRYVKVEFNSAITAVSGTFEIVVA